ncbi:MAG TPA: LLM class flavin-dependent oxidoreductase [Acidimicrobiales bacterium]|nr:LLM class flavin-dependent oxidoreductase [Acidimicrobiales bacterium]
MKVRIGIGTGAAGLDGPGLAGLADDLVTLGFDSLWLPEILTVDGADPLVGLAWAGAHNRRLKLGTTMLLPGRNPVRLAKQVAGLDALSGGRFLVTFVPGLARGPERDAIGVPPAERGAAIDEVLPLLRRLWAGEAVSYDGPAGRFTDVSVSPLPAQDPFEIWLGGLARSSLERCGRLADGWLPAMCGPEEAARGRQVVDEAAAAAGRSISPEHFGMSIGYAHSPLDDRQVGALAARAKGRPLEDLIPVGPEALRELLQRFVAVGFSKFVLRPLAPPADWRRELEGLAAAIGDLQT